MKHFSIKTISLSTLLGALLLTGCGETSNTTASNELEMPEVLVPTVSDKLQRVANVDAKTTLSISDDANNIVFTIKDADVGVDASEATFIDADSNPATGYKRGGLGAEYLIVGDNLYKNAGGNGYTWSWNFIQKITRATTADTATLTLSKNAVDMQKDIKAFSYLYDRSWKATAASDVVAHTLRDDNGGGNHNAKFKIENNAGALVFTIYSPLVGTDKQYSTAIFIDADNNPSTGYTNWYSGKLGAEYLIANDDLYRYQNASGYGWNWKRIDTAPTDIHDGQIEFIIPSIEGINQYPKSKAVASFTDRNWKVTEVFGPVEFSAKGGGNGGNAGTPSKETLLKLFPEGVGIQEFLVTPDKKSAIVLTSGYSEKAIHENLPLFQDSGMLIYVDFSDLNHPVFSKDSVIKWGVGYPYLDYSAEKPITIVDNNRVSYFTGNDNRYSYFQVIENFKTHKKKIIATDTNAALSTSEIHYEQHHPGTVTATNGRTMVQLTDTTWKIEMSIWNKAIPIKENGVVKNKTFIYDTINESFTETEGEIKSIGFRTHFYMAARYGFGRAYYYETAFQLNNNPDQWHVEYTYHSDGWRHKYKVTLIHDTKIDHTYFISEVEVPL